MDKKKFYMRVKQRQFIKVIKKMRLLFTIKMMLLH